MKLLGSSLLGILLIAGGTAGAAPYTVDFVTSTTGTQSDPDGLLPAGWDAGLGGFLPLPAGFSGSWTYDDAAVDQNAAAGMGDYLFNDPSLTIQLDAGGLPYEFQLDRISFVYSTVPGEWSTYSVFGSSSSSTLPGVASEEVEITFGQMSPLASFPGADSPHPLAGSPWEDGSGFSYLSVKGTNGLSGTDEKSYSWGKTLGSHGEPVATDAVPEPTGAVLFAAGLAVAAAARRRHA